MLIRTWGKRRFDQQIVMTGPASRLAPRRCLPEPARKRQAGMAGSPASRSPAQQLAGDSGRTGGDPAPQQSGQDRRAMPAREKVAGIGQIGHNAGRVMQCADKICSNRLVLYDVGIDVVSVARVMELVDVADSKSAAARRAGSSPASGTRIKIEKAPETVLFLFSPSCPTVLSFCLLSSCPVLLPPVLLPPVVPSCLPGFLSFCLLSCLTVLSSSTRHVAAFLPDFIVALHAKGRAISSG